MVIIIEAKIVVLVVQYYSFAQEEQDVWAS